MMGLYLALRHGVKHQKLRRLGFNSQISVELDDTEKKCLVYHEDPLQKTNQSGLVCKGTNKVVCVCSIRKKSVSSEDFQEILWVVTCEEVMQ